MEIVEILKTIGACAGALVTIITFFTLISKRPRAALRKIIREESTEANKELANKIEELEKKSRERFDKIDKKNLENDETNLAMLRNTITHIYFKYKDVKKIPHYEKENLISLYERYQQLHGNHYIKMIVEEMKDWEEII